MQLNTISLKRILRITQPSLNKANDAKTIAHHKHNARFTNTGHVKVTSAF